MSVTSHRVIHSPEAPAAVGPYSQAVALPTEGTELIFLAGQIALDPETGTVVEGDVSAQVEQIMRNLGAVLHAAGSGYDRVLKTTIFLCSMDDFAAVNEVYARSFGERPPARATVQVSGLPKGVQVEIEAVAYR